MNNDSFEPLVKRSSVAEEISERILRLLREKHLKPGDKLPPERELATMLQVSRPSLREALRALSIMNIIEIRQGDGTYISSLEPYDLLQQLEFIFQIDETALHQLFEARIVIEVGCAGLAAANMDDETIQHIAELVQRAEDTVGDPEAFSQADSDLHMAVIAASGNPLLIRFMESITQFGMASRAITTRSDKLRNQGMDDHKAILKALKNRDPEAAQSAMLKHLDHVERELNREQKG